jgi:hypothetical protein
MIRHMLVLLALLPALSACELLQQVVDAAPQVEQAQMPTVTYQDAVLVESPSKGALAAYYCPQVVPDPFGVAGASAVLCRGFFGSPPPAHAIRVSFDLHFVVKNPNHFPIPVAELLTAATVFPDKTNQGLGAACVAFCGADQPGCTGTPGPDACVSHHADIKSLVDFQQKSVNLLLAAGISALNGEKPTFIMPQVVQDGEILITARFTFGSVALLEVLKQVASQAVDQLYAGKAIEFTIPYRLEGTVWLDVGSLGRVELGWGPAPGVWTIPTDALVP